MELIRTRRFVDLLIAWRWFLLAIAVVLAAAAWQPAQQVTFDRSIENMFSPRDPVMVPFRHFKSIFGDQEMVLAVYEDPELMTAEGLARLHKVTTQLDDVRGVGEVLSLTQINELVRRVQLFGLADSSPPILSDRPLATAYRELFEGYTHNSKGDIAAIACIIDPNELPNEADPQRKVIDELRAELGRLPGGLAPGMVAGEPVMVVDGFRLVEEDGKRLGLWSTLLLSLTLAICFRSLRWLLAPLAVVQLTVLLTRAVLAILEVRLTLVSSMLTALVTVVGVATVTHLIVGFYDQRREGRTSQQALASAGTLLAWPILGAIATDMMGFGTLWWSSVGPVFDFGTMMVLGSLLVIPSTILIVPALAIGGYERKTPPADESSHLKSGLSFIVQTVAARRRWVLAGALLVGTLSVVGSLRLTVETDFTKNFRADSELVQSYDLIESRLGGAGVWDVIVPAPRVLDTAYVDRVLKLENELRQIKLPDENVQALTKVISLADAVRAAQADPALGLMPPEARASGMALVMPDFTRALRRQDVAGQSWLRIMIRSRERLPAEWKKQVLHEVDQKVAAAFPGNDREPPGEVTGYHVLVTTLVDSLISDQWIMFALSCGGIALMMLVAFRSPTLAVLCLVPNVLPVLLVTGLMGWLGIRINMGAAMIAAVSMGLSVDSSIHYITAFRRGLRQGRSVTESLEAVQQSVGKAMLLSTLAILVGFSVLCLSDFIPTIYFGLLAGLTMLGGLAGNLIILPLLLLWTTREKESQLPQAPSDDRIKPIA